MNFFAENYCNSIIQLSKSIFMAVLSELFWQNIPIAHFLPPHPTKHPHMYFAFLFLRIWQLESGNPFQKNLGKGMTINLFNTNSILIWFFNKYFLCVFTVIESLYFLLIEVDCLKSDLTLFINLDDILGSLPHKVKENCTWHKTHFYTFP